MADNYSFIAQGVQQPNALNMIGNIANTATAMQNYQRGNIELQKSQALLPTDIQQGQAQSAQAVTGAASADYALKKQQATDVLNEINGTLQDKRVQADDPHGMVDAVTEARDRAMSKGVPKATAEYVASQFISRAHDPGAVAGMIQNSARSNAGPATQAAAVNAPLSLVSTPGGQIVPVQLQPGAPGAIQPVPISALQPDANQPQVIPAGIPPALQQTSTTDALQRPAIAVKDQKGNISYQAPPGANYKPMMALPPGETPATALGLYALRDKAQADAATVQQEHYNNDQIKKLADTALSGWGSGGWQAFFNANGLQWTNDIGANTSQLQHFLALQTKTAALAAGHQSDDSDALAAKSVLPADAPAKAIKYISGINDALVTERELHSQGVLNALNNPANDKDIFALRDFQNQWSPNVNVDALRFINANKNWTGKPQDNPEVQALAKELGAAKMQQIAPKYKAIRSLADTGRLPQQ